MTFSTPVTPTRVRLTWVLGRRAWTSSCVIAERSVMARAKRYSSGERANPHDHLYSGRGSKPWWLSPSRIAANAGHNLKREMEPIGSAVSAT